jgi:guanylate kinase
MNSVKQGKLIILSAPSGSGKTTIVRHLLSLGLGMEFSISATSREPRMNEKNGVDYYFIDPETFQKKIEEGAFLEWEEVYADQFYGTLRSEVERIRDNGRHVIFDIDVVGGLNLKQEFGADALAIFVRPPSLEVMEQRLRARGTDSEEQLKKRLSKAAREMTYADRFDHVIINDILSESLSAAEKCVKDFLNFKT